MVTFRQKHVLVTTLLLVLSNTFFIGTSKSEETKANLNSNNKSITSSKGTTEKKPESIDSVITYLLDSSAKDFYDNQPPMPLNFRNVEVRNLIGENSENHYMLCGQFLTQDKEKKDKWTSFATIKTSKYEQWLGNQSLGYCKDSKAVSYKIKDLSSALKSKLASLKKSK